MQRVTTPPPLRPEDRLWLAVLRSEPELWFLSDEAARKVLKARGFPPYLVKAYLKVRATPC